MNKLKAAIWRRIIKLTYRYRREKALTEYRYKKNKYLGMNDDEFNVEYIETAARYEMKKISLSTVSLMLMLSIFMKIWNYIFDIIYKLLTANSQMIDSKASETGIILFIIIGSIVSFVFLLILYDKYKMLHMLKKEKLLLEEIRTIRNHDH